MGAFSKARDERNKVFQALVREGRSIQLRTRAMAEESIGEVAGRVTEVRDRATESWDKLEQVFEDRVSRALARLGVPTRKDVQALIKRVDELTASLNAMSGAAAGTPGAARKSAARKSAGGKAGAKKAATKRSRARKSAARRATQAAEAKAMGA